MSIGDRFGTMKLTFKWNKKEKRVEVNKETAGFTGKQCESVTEFIDKALGGKELEKRFTGEYYDNKDDREEKLRY